MNRKRLWKGGLALAVLLTCVLSWFVLQLDAKSKQGILHEIENKDTAQSVRTKEPLEESAEELPTSTAIQNQEASEIEPTSETKMDFLVIIDPGHQQHANLEQEPIGPGATETKYKVTGGTTGVVTNKPEYALNLEASFLLQQHLEARGMQVILTRTTNDIDLSNRERAEIANAHEADLFLRIHADGSENTATKGFSVLVPAQDNPYTTAIYKKSYQAAIFLIEHVSPTIELNQSGLFYRSDMSGFNWSKVPVILPEIGFMTNPEDDQNLSDETYLTNLMELIADGIEAYAHSIQ